MCDLLAGGPLTDSVNPPLHSFHQKPPNEEGLGIHPWGILITFTGEIRLSLARRQTQLGRRDDVPGLCGRVGGVRF